MTAATGLTSCHSAQCYLQLKARYCCIPTERVHFAIAVLIARRRVILLLPNDCLRNRSMHGTWLQEPGCDCAKSLRQGRDLLANQPWR